MINNGPNILGTVIDTASTSLVPWEPPKPKKPSAPWWVRIFIDIATIIPTIFSGGLAAPAALALDTASTLTNLGLNAAMDYTSTGKVSFSTIALGGLSLLGEGISTIKSLSIASKAEKAAQSIEKQIPSYANMSIKRLQVIKSTEKLAKKQIEPLQVIKNLQKAGFTDDEALKTLKLIKKTLAEKKINNKLLNQEIDFIDQERPIQQELNAVAEKFGFSILDVQREVLQKYGINIVGVKNLDKLSRIISKGDDDLVKKSFLGPLNEELKNSLDPKDVVLAWNADKNLKLVNKANKLVSLLNPTNFVTEIANKLFDPIRTKLEKEFIDPVKKKFMQKFNHLFRQDVLRKAKTKNGVFPCFGSSWINYLRAVPLGDGQYKCFVIFRKWGYQPVLITPPLTMDEIVNWSESSSPGRIYHRFRKKYGLQKGVYVKLDNSSEVQLFNALGFIPDKYISLGISLIGNVMTAYTAISMHTWTSQKTWSQPISDKIFETAGGEFAKAGRDQLTGKSPTAIRDYFSGKMKEHVEQHESEGRKHYKENQGKIGSLLSMKSIF